jgi:hypothetical protein
VGFIKKGENHIWTIIVILLVLWLLGAFGSRFSPNFQKGGNLVHILLVIAVVLIVLSLLKVI